MDDIALIRRTWAKAAAMPDLTAKLFYGRLFRIAPEVKPLFSTMMQDQGRKLVATLSFVVDSLEDQGRLIVAARALAVRHVDYRVEAAHYAPVGEALIWALGRVLGNEFTAEAEAAWSRVYGGLADSMIAAAYPADGAGTAET